MPQFGQDDRGLEGVEAEIAADDLVVVLGPRAVRPQAHQLVGALRVVGDDHAAVAGRAEVLGREEGEAAVMADRAGAAAFVLRADRLGGVFDDHKPVLLRDLHHGVHVGHLAVEMHGHDRPRAGGDLCLDLRRLQVVGGGVNIHEDGCGADARDAAGGGEEGVGRGDDLVARADPLGHQADEQGVSSGRDADRVSAA